MHSSSAALYIPSGFGPVRKLGETALAPRYNETQNIIDRYAARECENKFFRTLAGVFPR